MGRGCHVWSMSSRNCNTNCITGVSGTFIRPAGTRNCVNPARAIPSKEYEVSHTRSPLRVLLASSDEKPQRRMFSIFAQSSSLRPSLGLKNATSEESWDKSFTSPKCKVIGLGKRHLESLGGQPTNCKRSFSQSCASATRSAKLRWPKSSKKWWQGRAAIRRVMNTIKEGSIYKILTATHSPKRCGLACAQNIRGPPPCQSRWRSAIMLYWAWLASFGMVW